MIAIALPLLLTFVPPPELTAQPSDDRARPRLHLAIGSATSTGIAATGAFGLLGLSLDLGVQLGDDWSVYSHSSASTILLSSTAMTSLVSEWSGDGFSFSAGLGYAWWSSWGAWAGFNKHTAAIVAPVSMAYTWGNRDPGATVRHGVRFALEAAPGLTTSSSWGESATLAPAVMVSLMLGYVRW